MLNTTTSKNFSGTSTIDNVVVANMYANISENGNVNINKTITDQKTYVNNKELVEKDMSDFDEFVYSSIDADSTTTTTSTSTSTSTSTLTSTSISATTNNTTNK